MTDPAHNATAVPIAVKIGAAINAAMTVGTSDHIRVEMPRFFKSLHGGGGVD